MAAINLPILQRRASILATVLFCGLSGISFAQPLELSVSPSSASGTATSQASISLSAALARVEALSTSNWPSEGVVVRLQAGTYRLDTTLRINARMSGRNGAPLVFRGPSHGVAVLSGARTISAWSPVKASAAQALLPQQSLDSVMQATLSAQGVNQLGILERQGQGRYPKSTPLELFYRGRPMPLAQWPNQGFASIEAIGEGKDASVVQLAQGNFKAWAREADLWATGYWGEDWADEWIGVSEVRPDRRQLQLRGGPPLYGAKVGQRIKVVNALSELDSPGEWYVDRTSGVLYFWPPGALNDGDVEVSVLAGDLVALDGASHVHFDGLVFEGARGNAIVVNGGRDVRVERSRIHNVGNAAVRMSGIAHAVLDSDIYDTGQGGVFLQGGDRQTLVPGELLAQGNRINRFSRWVKTYRPAISLMGVGNVARGNLISDAAHTGLIFLGNDHLIEFNEMYDLAQETGDVGAIYTGRDWTARGTIVRYNYLHNIRGPGRWGSNGIYLDDQASGITVLGNVFVEVDHPIFLGGGRDNLIDNNLLIDSSPAIHLDARGRTWQGPDSEAAGQLRKRLSEVPYQKSPYVDRYPKLANLLDDSPGSPRGNVARRNAVIGGKPLELLNGVEKELEIDRLFNETDIVVAKPLGKGRRQPPEAFAPQPGSPGLRAGFASLPLSMMGCTARRWDAYGAPQGDLQKLPSCN